MHQDHALGHATGGLVDFSQTGKGIVHALAIAWGQAEHVFQATAGDGIRHAHVDHERRVVLGRSLGGGQGDGAGKATHVGRHRVLLQALDLGHTHFRPALRVAQHGLHLGAAQGLDAAGCIDLINGPLATQATLAAAVSERTADGVDQTDLHRAGLGHQEAWCPQDGAGRTGLEHKAA